MSHVTPRCPPCFGLVLLLIAGAHAAAGQVDTRSFIMLERGMTESEILVRAGSPDLVTSSGVSTVAGYRVALSEIGAAPALAGIHGAVDALAVSHWHYIPSRSEHDPHITVVTFRGGRVWNLDRIKVFDRSNLPLPAPAEPAAGRRSDYDIRAARAERTLEAARAYADTRHRIKRRQAEHAGGRAPAAGRDAIFTSVRPDGSVYFGDRPAE